MKRGLLAACLAVPVALLAQPDPDPVGIITTLRANYPATVTPDHLAALMREIAEAFNGAGVPGGPYGLLRKTTGRSCGGWACDTLCVGNGDTQRQWDVLVASSAGEARPIDTWNPAGRTVPDITVRPCVEMGGAPPPPTDPVPDPPTHECPTCPTCPTCPPDQQAQVVLLERLLVDVKAERDAALAELETWRTKPAPRCEIANSFWRLFGIGCRVVP